MLPSLRPFVAVTLPRSIRMLHASSTRRSSLTNILADDAAPALQVKSITPEGRIELVDGLLLSGACIFLSGRVFLWDVPITLWDGWDKDRFQIFDVVVPKPEILIFGTGRRMAQLPPFIRNYLREVGMQVDTMDTRSACSTYNLLAEEGRNVAAALLPLTLKTWKKGGPP